MIRVSKLVWSDLSLDRSRFGVLDEVGAGRSREAPFSLKIRAIPFRSGGREWLVMVLLQRGESVLHRAPAASISSVYGARTCISRKHFCSKRRAPDADIHTWILLVFFSRTSILTAARGRSREVDSSSRLKSCLAKVWCPTPGRSLTLTNRVA